MSATFEIQTGQAVENVRVWRLEQLLAGGYPPADARTLSERSDIDLHVAVGLLEHGCAPETAVRIVL